MILRRAWTPATTRLLQLFLSLLLVQYLLLLGGSFGPASFAAQRLNWLGGAGLAVGWLLVRLIQGRQFRFVGLELPVFAFAASQWLAVVTSVQPRLGLDWVATVTTWTVGFFILADCLANGWPRSFWLNALLVAAIIIAADGIWSAAQWFTSWVALGILPPVAFRYNGLLGHANLTACVINLLWPVVIARIKQTGRILGRVALGGLLMALAGTSFFTSSRAGWVAGGAAVMLLAALLAYSRTGQNWLRVLGGLWQRAHAAVRLLTILGIALFSLVAGWLFLKQGQNITHGSLFESRQQFWSAAFNLFKSRPLTGVGPDLFGWNYSRFASIPPDFFALHAHSVPMQILSGSGLVGIGALLFLCAAVALRLWKQWLAGGRRLETACLIGALFSFVVHALFDFPVTPIVWVLLIVLLALALSPTLVGGERQRSVHFFLTAPFVLLPIGLFGFLLRGSAGNDAGLKLADANQWPAAAEKFEQTAQGDPYLTLYWEEAAYAYTRAGDIPQALPLWDRAERDDPNWALLPATIGALRQDLAAAQSARTLAPGSYLFALNAGAIAEAQGDIAAAQAAYLAALQLKPAIAKTLYWQQSPLRQRILSDWQSRLPPDSSALAKGWAALTSNTPDQAVAWFRQAGAEDPNSLAPYLGLGQASLKLGDLPSAQHFTQAALGMPVLSLEETLPVHLLAGDVDAARGDRAGAIAEYSLVFSGVADYNVNGPGSYGYPERSWYVFHRAALPGELVPQLLQADMTPEMDQRFALLAQWYRADGQGSLACWILGRVRQAAPDSVSGREFANLCP